MGNVEDRTGGQTALSCRLVGRAFVERKDAITRDLFAHAERVEELPDGFAWRFRSDEPWPTTVLAFIAAERQCCPFFTFEVVFEPNDGPLWLRLRGPEGAKAFIRREVGTQLDLPPDAHGPASVINPAVPMG